jgi:uncharacterized SAM-binding protein YcdF (DUF218 family)
MNGWLVTSILANALLPPFSLALLILAGLILLRRVPRFARALLFFTAAALYGLSTPWVSGLLLKSLEISRPIELVTPLEADAIVVLGGGRRTDALEYGSDTVNSLTLERLRYAAHLQRISRLPLMVTGGMPGGGSQPEGRLMHDILVKEFKVPVKWVEDRALTTWDNARLSAPRLHQAGVERIVLVSHAWHLRRAVPQFEGHGLDVIPAGTQFSDTRIDSFLSLLPNALGLRDSYFALHEWLGVLWYKLRARLELERSA